MLFWCYMFISCLLMPIICIVAGRIMWKHYPKKINRFCGYRTKYSMINDNTWKFAHNYCGKLWWKIGWISFLITFIAEIFTVNSRENVISTVGGVIVALQIIALLMSIFATEKKLRKTFSEDGKLK